jgi:hypothetical protein
MGFALDGVCIGFAEIDQALFTARAELSREGFDFLEVFNGSNWY